MAGPGQPKKPLSKKRVIFTARGGPIWLKKFREWSKTQPDSQGHQLEAGINLLMKEREDGGK